jgi:hypothetical protein
MVSKTCFRVGMRWSVVARCSQAIVFGGQVPPGLAQMLSERTELFGRPRYGVPRPHPKLIVSDISGDAAAMGSAIVPFKSTFY